MVQMIGWAGMGISLMGALAGIGELMYRDRLEGKLTERAEKSEEIEKQLRQMQKADSLVVVRIGMMLIVWMVSLWLIG